VQRFFFMQLSPRIAMLIEVDACAVGATAIGNWSADQSFQEAGRYANWSPMPQDIAMLIEVNALGLSGPSALERGSETQAPAPAKRSLLFGAIWCHRTTCEKKQGRQDVRQPKLTKYSKRI
jgi:hypothetical protein